MFDLTCTFLHHKTFFFIQRLRRTEQEGASQTPRFSAIHPVASLSAGGDPSFLRAQQMEILRLETRCILHDYIESIEEHCPIPNRKVHAPPRAPFVFFSDDRARRQEAQERIVFGPNRIREEEETVHAGYWRQEATPPMIGWFGWVGGMCIVVLWVCFVGVSDAILCYFLVKTYRTSPSTASAVVRGEEGWRTRCPLSH